MMQNTSHAVMAQRIEPHDSLDFFPTPPWATRALCEELGGGEILRGYTAWEPACGQGDMARPMAEYFRDVYASDVHPYGFGATADFLLCGPHEVDWVITNPPFKLAQEFIAEGLKRARRGVAVLVRTAFLESVGRYNELFRETAPTYVMQFTERVPMHKGKLTATGSTATAYCWLVWDKRRPREGTYFKWIAPCRKRLERPEDYSRYAA